MYASSNSQPAPRATPPKLVLLVDDDAEIRYAMSLALGDEGFQVATAANGRAALDLLEGGLEPSVILLDLMMPVMDGHEFLDQLGRLPPALASVPVVVLSAAIRPEEPRAREVIRKPFNLDAVLRALNRWIGP